MNQIKNFLRFVEIQTKVASVIPFSIGTLYAIYAGYSLNILNLLLMFTSLLCVDMMTTGLNHYMDFKKAYLKEGYHYEVHNPMGKGAVGQRAAKKILIGLFVIGFMAGVVLVYRTDFWVLLLGALAFGVGLTYSMGPLPISRTVLGEISSGFFMGGLIPFIAFYIHAHIEPLMTVSLNKGLFLLSIEIQTLLPIIGISMPLIALIANIMLANNICDMEEDFINKRYTLPIAMGKEKALTLYKGMVCFSVLVIGLGILTRLLPVSFAVVFVGIPLFIKQTKFFVENPIKGKTFIGAVKNFVMFGILLILGLVLAL